MALETETDAEGATPVVVRRATGADDVARLRAEAERLRRAAHPGVVQVVSSGGDDDTWELRTMHGGRPLPVACPLSAEALAGVAAAAAATLADLHALGVVHGRLRADHILLGPHGRPVLCGFGPGVDAPAVEATPADDVAALGAILSDLLGDAADAEPFPDRRWQRRSGWSGWVRRSLLTLADQACAEPSTRRPSARRFAAAIADAVPDARAALDTLSHPAVEPAPDEPPDPIEALRATVGNVDPVRPLGTSARRLLARTAAAAIVIGVALTVLGTVGIDSSPSASDRPSTETGSSPAGFSTSTNFTPPTTHPPAAPVETTSQPPSSPPCAVPIGRGRDAATRCDQITVDGTMVSVGDRRFEVGRPGDHIVIGDWDCYGGVSPALLRPATGLVFVFPTWAGDHELTVDPVAEVLGAAALVSEDVGGGCHVLGVRLHTGEVVDLTRSEIG